MFTDEIKKLTPYDKYIIIVEDLRNTYLFADSAYQHGRFEIEYKIDKNVHYYLDDINTYRNKLKCDYELALQIKDKVNQQSLDESEKKLFDLDNKLFEKIQRLLTMMDSFLSQYNIELSV